MENRLIGNERKNDEDLVAKAITNPLIKIVLEGKEEAKIAYTGQDYIDKAKELVDNVVACFYLPNGPLESSLLRKKIAGNSLLAIDKIFLDDKPQGHTILNVMLNNLELDDKLGVYMDSWGQRHISGNALFAVALLLTGEKKYEEKAKQILSNITNAENFYSEGHYQDLLYEQIGNNWTSSEANISTSLAYIFQRKYQVADAILKPITLPAFETKTPEYKSLIPLITTVPNGEIIETTSNALFGVVTYLMMKDKPINERIEKAKIYADKIEEHFFDHGLVINGTFHTLICSSSSLSLSLLYLTLAGKFDDYVYNSK
jgi:hypothetical protein